MTGECDHTRAGAVRLRDRRGAGLGARPKCCEGQEGPPNRGAGTSRAAGGSDLLTARWWTQDAGKKSRPASHPPGAATGEARFRPDRPFWGAAVPPARVCSSYQRVRVRENMRIEDSRLLLRPPRRCPRATRGSVAKLIDVCALLWCLPGRLLEWKSSADEVVRGRKPSRHR